MNKLGKMAGLLKNAGKIQEAIKEAKASLAHTTVVGEAGAGLVTVTMSGDYRTHAVSIQDEAWQEGKGIVEELVAAATNDAMQKVQQVVQEKISEASGGMGGMGDIGDLFGGD